MGILERSLVDESLADSKFVSLFGIKIAKFETELTNDKVLRLIPPIPSVVGAASLSERIGREIIDETLDYEHILKLGGKLNNKSLRNLANILSGVMSSVESDRISDERFNAIKNTLGSIVRSWSNREENKLS